MRITHTAIALSSTVMLIASSALVAAPAFAVEVAPPRHATATASTSAGDSLPYSDRDVVEFLVFGRGAIAADKPDLATSMGITPIPDAPAHVTDKLLADLMQVDPSFNSRVTVPAQAGDPYMAEASIKAFSADVQKVAAEYRVSEKTLRSASVAADNNGQVTGFANYVISTQVVVAAALAVSVLGVVAALVVFAYQNPGDSSSLAREGYAAAWASL
jgi:SdpC family antimicrobial peptide